MSTPNNNVPQFDYSDLPPELNGKSGAEIAAYFADRERRMQAKIDQVTPPANPPPANNPSGPSPQDWWTNPGESARKVAADEANKVVANATAGVAPGLIEVARFGIAQKYPNDFAQFEPDIKQIMNTLSPQMQMDPTQWETAYFYVKGKKADKLVADAKATATAGVTTIAGEPPSGGRQAPPVPETASPEQHYVATHLGLTDKSYLEGKANMEAGNWPLTMNNMQRR